MLTNTKKAELREQAFRFLDDLRSWDDAPNMLGAVPYLEAAFVLDRKEAEAILLEWRHTFDERHLI